MKVLVVDDAKNIRLLLTKCLEMEGHSVEVASDGATALELLSHERFDLAFLDIKMPHLSGTEVLKKIRGMGIPTPVIIITAYATVKNAIECTNLGAVAYLQKPFTAEKIKSVLDDLMYGSDTDCGIDSVLGLAKRKMDMKAWVEAERILKSALPGFSLNAELYIALAEVSRALNKAEEAEKYEKIYQALL